MSDKKINKDVSFSELMQKHPEAIEVLMNSGMHCIGCPMAMQETLEEGILAHGLDLEKTLKKINEEINKNGRKK